MLRPTLLAVLLSAAVPTMVLAQTSQDLKNDEKSTGDVLVYLDADCRAPVTWLERVERRFLADPQLLALSGPYRFYDWDWWGRLLIRA